MPNNKITGKEAYTVLNDTRDYVHSNIIRYCKTIHQNAKGYVEPKSVEGLRCLMRKLFYEFLKCQVVVDGICKGLISGKVMKIKKYHAVKKEVAGTYFKGFELCKKSKFAPVMQQVGMDKNIEHATELLGYSIEEHKSKKKMKYSLVPVDKKNLLSQN